MRKILIFVFLVAAVVSMLPGKPSTSRKGMRSSDLQKVVTEDGGTQRTDYVFDGVITYAADKHYATLIKTKEGNTLLERYYDENGQPEQQTSGHHALLREYDENGRNIKTTYLGADLKPVMNTSRYARWVRTYNEQGLMDTERYYDTEGHPTEHRNGYFGKFFRYENKRNTEIVYFDQSGDPVITKSGYAMLKQTFYENGNLENQYYFDEKNQPIALQNGEYGLHREYDEQGRTDTYTYLGRNGEPVMTKSGYATLKRTFYPDNTARTDMYYDADGQPAALARGQYGILREDDKTILLRADGKPFFNLGSYLYGNPLMVILLGLSAVLLSVGSGRKVNAGLLAFYLIFIIYMTLMERTEGDNRANLTLFWSYRQFLSSPSLRVEILNNILLFVPLGAILYCLIGEPWSFLLPLLISGSIEVIQYFTGLGLAEFDDIISNGLGGLIGSSIAVIIRPWIRKRIRKIS